MDILYVSHNLFLTKEQRYNLFNGNNVETVGTSICVLNSLKFKNPEEVKEYFCLYKLIPKKNITKSIKSTKKGFNIYLFSEKTNNTFFDLVNEFFFGKKINKENTKKLLDIKDGGSEWLFLIEQEFKKNLIIFHKLQIQKIENLLESLVL